MPTLADRALRLVAALYLAALLALALAYHALWFDSGANDALFMAYGAVVVAFITSRFLLSLPYRPPRDAGLEPRVAIVMPAFNEDGVIAHSLRSLLALDYPLDKLELVAVNDGSTDETLARMAEVAADEPRVRVIDLGVNCGKRAAMAVGMRATDAELLAFVDSDSSLEPDALRRLVQGFADPQVGAICGHADVANPHEGWLARMQVVRYFVAFRVVKAAESLFGCVTCCSGCFSAYRRAAIVPHLEAWEHQTFLGSPATFGDDRALTNRVLRDWKVLYAADAISHTAVPTTLRQFLKQQLRWKRSWTRESLILMRFVWRKHPLAAALAYAGVLISLVAPVVAIRALVWLPLVGKTGFPLIYVAGIYAMALAYGLYYVVRRPRYDPGWIYGVVFCFFYLAFLLWQTYWAIVTARSSAWGTRPATGHGRARPAPNAQPQPSTNEAGA
ncbi:MAG: glycosyltransferase family 2 protein [Actinobacteria bacterium]|nr:glycosyltransferase family 2 protein [Actinomycetota bacterium]